MDTVGGEVNASTLTRAYGCNAPVRALLLSYWTCPSKLLQASPSSLVLPAQENQLCSIASPDWRGLTADVSLLAKKCCSIRKLA